MRAGGAGCRWRGRVGYRVLTGHGGGERGAVRMRGVVRTANGRRPSRPAAARAVTDDATVPVLCSRECDGFRRRCMTIVCVGSVFCILGVLCTRYLGGGRELVLLDGGACFGAFSPASQMRWESRGWRRAGQLELTASPDAGPFTPLICRRQVCVRVCVDCVCRLWVLTACVDCVCLTRLFVCLFACLYTGDLAWVSTSLPAASPANPVCQPFA